jgi:hypothetical protein
MLNTHKGTVVRVTLKLDSGNSVELNPLKQSIGGLVFDGPSLKGVVTLKPLFSSKAGEWSLLNSHGSIWKRLKDYADGGALKSIVVLVVYPDGTVWEGKIGGNLKDVSLIAWSDEIIRSLVDPSEILRFYQPTWSATPTSIVVRKGGGIKPMCAHIEHSCGKQCE